ncbi:26608_t:CDS:2, partial [Gigaspora margarita]
KHSEAISSGSLIKTGKPCDNYINFDDYTEQDVTKKTEETLCIEINKGISLYDDPVKDKKSDHLYKIGKTKSVGRRLEQWEKKCHYKAELVQVKEKGGMFSSEEVGVFTIFFFVVKEQWEKKCHYKAELVKVLPEGKKCKYTHRTERRIHLELEVNRVDLLCDCCKQKHNEGSSQRKRLYGNTFFRLEKSNIKNMNPLEVNLHYTHNHLPNSTASLSFRPVSAETRKQYIDLFSIGHTAATARHTYEDKLHLSASNDDELNPDGGFLRHLYSQFRLALLGDRNGKGMFERLQEMVDEYNSMNSGKAVLQIYDSIKRVFLTSDEAEVTIENTINLLKTMLPDNAFYRHGPQVGPKVIITDDSNAE